MPFPTEFPEWDPLIVSTASPLPHSLESWTPLFKSQKPYNKDVFVPILQMGEGSLGSKSQQTVSSRIKLFEHSTYIPFI